MNQGERIASMETRLAAVERKVDKMDAKLDELLALRNKGAGVFWLISCLVGIGIGGSLLQVFTWLKPAQ